MGSSTGFALGFRDRVWVRVRPRWCRQHWRRQRACERGAHRGRDVRDAWRGGSLRRRGRRPRPIKMVRPPRRVPRRLLRGRLLRGWLLRGWLRRGWLRRRRLRRGRLGRGWLVRGRLGREGPPQVSDGDAAAEGTARSLPWVRAVLGCAGARRGALGPHLHQAAGGRPAATASWRWKGRAHAAEAVTCPTAREPCGLAPER